MFKAILVIFSFLPAVAIAQGCPGEDPEAAITAKTSSGQTLILCGFEDREVQASKGKRAFSDFTVYYFSEKATDPKKLFQSEESETYWASENSGKGIVIEELWFFSEKPQPAIRRELTCTAEACQISEPKCIFKMKPNPFPKALSNFQARAKQGKLTADDDELLDQIFAQAMTGNAPAKKFYEKRPAEVPDNLAEVFEANRGKLVTGCK